MKIIFAHDHIFKVDKEKKIYTKGGLPKEIWGRYMIEKKSEILVIARSEKVNEISGLKEAERENVKFMFINEINKIINKIIPAKEIKSKIEKEIKLADLVVVRLPSELGNLTYDIAKRCKKKIVVEVVACVWDGLWNYGSAKAKIYAPLAFYKMKKRIKKSKYNIYVTKEWLQKKYPTNGKTISCSNVELDYVDRKILRIRKSNRLKSEIKLGLIGNVGNKIKGIDVALRAINILKRKNYKIKLKILGSGDKAIWASMILDLNLEKEVEFEGVLPSGEPVLKWLDNIDIYIQPSYQEGLPRAVIEAMSRGLPIVTSNAGGCGELINPKLVHKKGSHKELAIKIEELINQEDLRRKEGEINQKKSKQYLKSKLFKRREQFFKSIMND